MKYDFAAEIPQLEKVTSVVKECLQKLYVNDHALFDRNDGQGVGERCLVFRFAYYLQGAFSDYFVDCDFNSSSDECGQLRDGKQIRNPDGTSTNRFVDVIIHERGGNGWLSDFICFEIKKWNNGDRVSAKKDKNNLRELTSKYGYKYGFYLIFGKEMQKTTWMIYQRDQAPSELVLTF